MARLAALLLAAVLGCAAFAQGSATHAPAEPTVAELRARLDRIPSSVDTNVEVRDQIMQINAIGAQADKFVASRTGPLNDLNARLGELGNPPPPGAAPEDPDITRQQAERIRDLMNAHDRDCLVTGYEDLIPALTLPDADDRHVLAAALRAGADVMVTSNLVDFPAETLER